MSQNKIWSETGGARVGRNHFWSLNASWPFATLNIRREIIELSYTLGKVTLERKELRGIELVRGAFSKGVRFEHICPNKPRLVVFWSRNVKNLANQLTELGYTEIFGALLVGLVGAGERQKGVSSKY